MCGLKDSRGRFYQAYYSLAKLHRLWRIVTTRADPLRLRSESNFHNHSYSEKRILIMRLNLNIAGDTVILSRMYLFPSMSSISSRVLLRRLFHVHDSRRSQWHRYQRVFLYRVLSRVQVCNSKNDRPAIILFIHLTENVSARIWLRFSLQTETRTATMSSPSTRSPVWSGPRPYLITRSAMYTGCP